MKAIAALALVSLVACSRPAAPPDPATFRFSPTVDALDAAAAPATPTPASRDPVVSAGADLYPGTDCTTAAMPTWTYDASKGVARLSAANVVASLPDKWTVTVERPDLVVVTSPDVADGVRPTFELFVSPVCKTYTAEIVDERIAARGLAPVLSKTDAQREVAASDAPVGLGGEVGLSLIRLGVKVTVPGGTRSVDLYVSDAASTATFGIHAAAICPTAETQACTRLYNQMLKSID